MFDKHTAYAKDDIHVLVIDQDDKLEEVWYIGILIFHDEIDSVIQIPFVPVHYSLLDDYCADCWKTYDLKPASIEHIKTLWINFNFGTRTFFTSSIDDIVQMALNLFDSFSKEELTSLEYAPLKYNLNGIFPTQIQNSENN